MKALLDARTGDVLVYDGEPTGKPALRLRPAAALVLAQQMASVAGVALSGQARDVRVGDLVDVARAVFKR